MYYTCLVGPLSYEAWVCGKLSIALTTPFWLKEPAPAGFDSLIVLT